jgi:hypothetical protein
MDMCGLGRGRGGEEINSTGVVMCGTSAYSGFVFPISHLAKICKDWRKLEHRVSRLEDLLYWP